MTAPPKLVHIVTVPMSFWLVRGHAALMSGVGFAVHAICSPGPLAEAYSRNENVPVDTVPMPRRMAPLADLLALVRLCAALWRLKPQVVQAGTPKAGMLGTIAACLLRVPVRVYHVHGLPVLTARGIRRLILRAGERVTCAAATHVLCVSHSMRDALVDTGLCAARKAIVLGDGSCNGVDTGWFDRGRLPERTREDVRSRLGIPHDALVVGFVGRVGREKGIGELHLAWRELRERFASAYLLIVGPPETTDPPPEEALRELGLDPRVRMTGEDWDTAPLYMAMDVCCLPSHREGFPNVPLEAAAMELPVVAFGVPGTVDAVEDGVTGRLVEPMNVKALAGGIGTYLVDPAMRQQHGQAGRRRVVARFGREKVSLELTKFYLSVKNGLRPPRPARPKRGGTRTDRACLKRTIDVLGASIALIVAAPALLLIAATLRIRLGSPVLFRQMRPGLYGKPFRIVKFRTMSDERDTTGRLLQDAARLSVFGAFLRSTSLDELPELWNVLKGEMSLVGPRPLLMEYLERYTPEQSRRHAVRPGITGLAQVRGRNALTWDEKFALDLEYVERGGLLLDIRILLSTMWQVITRQGISQPGHATAEEFVGSAAR